MKPIRTPLLQLAALLPVLTLPLHAVVTANDDGDAGTPFFSVSQSSVVPGFASVTANDVEAGDIFSSDPRSAANAVVLLALDGTGTYDPRVSGSARALATGETLIDTFSYTVKQALTPGVSDTLDPTLGVETFGWAALPAPVAAFGPGLPSGITLAYELDGTAGSTRTAFDDAQSTADASFEFWIRPDVVNAYQTLFETGGSGTGSGVFLNDDGTVSFLCKSGDDPFVQSGTVLTVGTWYHIAVVYDFDTTSTFSLYINGASEGSATSTTASDWSGSDGAGLGQVSATSAGDNVDIDGVAGSQLYGNFTGQVGLVRYYQGTALSATQVADNFNAASVTDSATVTVEVTGSNDRPNALDDISGSTLEDGTLVSTASLIANDGPVRYAPFRANLNYDAGVGVDGSLWRNIGLLQATGGDLTLTGGTLDSSPGSARPGITAAIDFDDTTGGQAIMSGAPGTSIESFPEGLDTTDATIEVWAKLAPGDLTQISTLFETGGGAGFGLVVDNGVLQAATEFDGGPTNRNQSFVSYDLVADSLNLVGNDPTTDFNHYVVTIQVGGGLELFVNGVSVAATTTGTSGDWSGSDPLGVGAFAGSNHGGFVNGAATAEGGIYNTKFKGSIAAFRIYGSALAAGQVASAFSQVAEPETDVLYANYDASVAGTASVWPNLGLLQPGANGGVINFTGVTLDSSPGSARTQITKAYAFPSGGGGSGVMSADNTLDGLNEFSAANGPIDQSDLSLEFWVKLNANDLGQISTLFEAGGGTGVGLVIDKGVVKGAAGIGLGEVSYDLTTDSLGLLSMPGDPTTEFFQVVLACDLVNDRNLLYVNGTLVNTADGNTATDLDGGDGAGIGRFGEVNHGGFTNGAAGTAYDTEFRGSMAIFRIYGGALTEAQVRQNYEAVDAGTDVDGDTLAVTGIFDGTGTLQGISSPATLNSGAIVTLDSTTGGFTYEPNGAFNALNLGDSATDTFTYQITDGNGAVAVAEVEVTIVGQPSNLQPAATNTTQTIPYTSGATNVPVVPAIVTSDGNNGIASSVDALFLWDGVQTTFPGGGVADDNDFNTPSPVGTDGFAVDLVFIPTAADVQADTTAPLYQVGGTSNGHGIYLYDGIPHLLVKMDGGGGDFASDLTDTDWTDSVISVPLTASAVTADEATDLSLIFSLDAVAYSVNGGATQTIALTNRGAKFNWYGNLSSTIGIRGTGGNNGGTRQTGLEFFDYLTLSDFAGSVPACRLWNASATDTVAIDSDVLTATLTMNPAEGALSVPTGASFDGTTWTYVGTPAQVGAALAALEFLPNGTTPVDVSVDIRDGEEDGAVPVTGTLTFLVSSPIQAWRLANGLALDGSEDLLDGDSDMLVNLLELAFGTDPSIGDNLPLELDGSVNGTPIAVASGGGGVTFNAYFVRRDDYLAAGLTYTPEFSSDLVNFYASTVDPEFVADSTDDSAYEVVSVPYPAVLLPDNTKARFYRVRVDLAP